MEGQQMMDQEQFMPDNRMVVSIGNWIVTMLIMIIPLVNIIMLFVWSFSSSTPKSKANWAKASLIFMAIGFVLMIAFWGTLTAAFLASSPVDSYY
ncbi:hypothetical protein Bcop_1818 [Bacteroides coprosuis DSM 18011]|uniref:Uncharacterized protein n=1 Tax=Bacteroides coprosuis DSM 18011 TaxID=679937 RepID=F3ZRR7_9BACE|nr:MULTISPECIES: hypothetical protein [Bacteroides]EGJ72006.1 hypothetical protein Bcop_1818 [Bacteroides coprosuis DSM 18011]HJD92762.1 hypothetical protein [Bacteroides coprosuis]